MLHQITIPKELVNDDAYLVARILEAPGERVVKGQPLAELETSKAAFSLVSPADGIFHPDCAENQTVPVGGIFGHIADNESDVRAGRPAPSPVPNQPDARFSRSAWDLFQSGGLAIDMFKNMPHVRRADVEKALRQKAVTQPDKNALVLLGGGGHARECIEAIEQAGVHRIHGIVDAYAQPGALIAGYPVLGNNAFLETLRKEGSNHLVLAYGIAGKQADRGAHFRELEIAGHEFPAIIHPKAAVHTHAVLGRGIHVMAGAVIGSEAVIGDACIINTNAVVSHDCRLDANVHIAPGAVLAGNVAIGENSVIGMGATVFMRTKIGKNVVVYNGADIFADVPDNTIVTHTWMRT
jgi:sugar O-acyltransferase, sialic acid O-acetyltransferase NeuD family